MQSFIISSRAAARVGALAVITILVMFASLLVVPSAQALNDTGDGGIFIPTTGRILDTANNIGFNTPMTAKEWRTIKVAGLAGIPTDGSAGAVSVVATVADITSQGQLTGRPNADTPSTLMTIYGGGGLGTTSNSAILALNNDGTIQVQTETKTRLVLDVQGYYTANVSGTAAGGFVPVGGKRIADTRSGLGTPQAALKSGDSVDIQVTGTAGVPAGASAVVVNLIAINTTTTNGFLTPYATGTTRPKNSLNYGASTTNVPTSVTAQVPLSAGGKMTVYNQSSVANLVVDVQGYFTAAGKTGNMFTPGTGRIIDTRTSGNTIVGSNETRSIQIAGKGGVPVVGSGLTAVVLTLTALHAADSAGNVTIWAEGASRPNTTSLNYTPNSIRSNTITVPVAANGKISLNNVGDPTHYILDVQGWYADPIAPKVSCPAAYAAGSWTNSLPSSPVLCNVDSPAALSSDAMLFVLVDGEAVAETDLSATSSLRTTVPVQAKAGWHTVDAIILQNDGTSSSESFSFGLNDGVPSPSLAAIQKASPETFLHLASSTPDVTAKYAIQTVGDQASTIPSAPTGTVTVTATDAETGAQADIQTGLPFANQAANATAEASGIVSYDNRNGSVTVPIAHADGSVALNTVLTSADAPGSFAYPLSIPAGGTVSLGENGAVTVADSAGTPVGFVDAPWAVDAAGVDVPTHYEIQNNTVTQVITLNTPGIQFPVVADPDMWSVIGSAIGCAAEIAAIALASAKVLQAFLKAEKIVKGIKKAVAWYNKLGGTMEKVVKLLKKYVKNKSSLSKKQVEAVSGLFHEGGKVILNIIGLGSCWSLATANYS